MLHQVCKAESTITVGLDDSQTVHLFRDDRDLTLALTHPHLHVHLTNDQKQTIKFTQSLVTQRDVTLETPIGRFILAGNIDISDHVFEQTKDLDYTFFRYAQGRDTIVILPPFVDVIHLSLLTKDGGKTWLIEKIDQM